MIGPEKLTILLGEVCCVDCIIEVGVFPLGEVESPPDEGEGGVKPTWVPIGTLLGEVCCVDCIIKVGVFPLGEVENPPDEREEGVKPTWVPVGTLLGVDRSVDVVFVALDRISSMRFPLESYLCP
ncbi:MAG: hypothetical protein K940chlam9_01821 [Chlamydiae bacterium]|nr:hypothetical protein [Chlamydiota bacterium]